MEIAPWAGCPLSGLFDVEVFSCEGGAADSQGLPSCNTTVANGIGILGNEAPGMYGNEQLSVGQWPAGIVIFRPGGPGFVTPDGGLGTKFGWRRGVRGHLTVTGRRLDAPALPLRARIPQGYGDFGFQSTYLIFSTPGCWEVTGRVGDASLTLVTNVVKIGDGPTSRDDPGGVELRLPQWTPPNTRWSRRRGPVAGAPRLIANVRRTRTIPKWSKGRDLGTGG